jgi:hypothetical protein
MPLRKYPPPPTGHDLMAMFPPAPPNKFETLPGFKSTSDFFKCQERAFFAHAGKEIVRVRVEGDFPHHEGSESGIKQRPASRLWHLNSLDPGPSSSTANAVSYHSPGQRLPSQPANDVLPPLSSHTPTSSSNQFPSNLHPPVLLGHQAKSVLLTPPEVPEVPELEDTAAKHASEDTEEHELDESWRRPMPYAERRRAGKHTRRVIVRT